MTKKGKTKLINELEKEWHLDFDEKQARKIIKKTWKEEPFWDQSVISKWKEKIIKDIKDKAMAEKTNGGLFSESGKTSMGRLLAFITVISGLVIGMVAVVLALTNGEGVGEGISTMVLGLVGIGLGSKIGSKFAEKK